NEDKFLSLSDYLNGYKKDERKFNQDFQKLLKYSKTLNDKLHILKVKESNRSLLISGTLIALSDKAFVNSYKFENPPALVNLLVNKIKEKLSSVQNQYIQDITTAYSFIITHTIFSKQEGILKKIIDEIDEKINSFIKNYQYFDTLGQFYIEFLRYANNDKGLGIVLTPPHITELFSEIANITKDSIVLDTCTGTGGFLISAMKKMIIDAGGDNEKESNIKRQQIVGVELQHDLYSLLCSNMYIHGDGRSNLIKGNCFDNDIKNQISYFKPNVGLLNPPYKTNKNDIEELEFVLNALDLLEKGSLCIAIIPMSCMLAKKRY
ncbi:MAG: SAM-dependent methyltransferase, partial [Rickettsia endosymbiont of Graphium doson]|nr:SAM-dependent methyltransferase [Rickettsia endosymbiont of Graphium doson]